MVSLNSFNCTRYTSVSKCYVLPFRKFLHKVFMRIHSLNFLNMRKPLFAEVKRWETVHNYLSKNCKASQFIEVNSEQCWLSIQKDSELNTRPATQFQREPIGALWCFGVSYVQMDSENYSNVPTVWTVSSISASWNHWVEISYQMAESSSNTTVLFINGKKFGIIWKREKSTYWSGRLTVRTWT